MIEKERSFRVFYRDYVNEVNVSSAAPQALDADRVGPLAEALLQHADNFLGVVDDKDTILQAYLDDDEQSVFLELIYHESPGCLRLNLPWAEALERLTELPDEFDDSLLPGASYIG